MSHADWLALLDHPPPAAKRPRWRTVSEAVHRALSVSRALAASARLERPTWDGLGAWRVVVQAPLSLRPEDIHPGVEKLVRANLPLTMLA